MPKNYIERPHYLRQLLAYQDSDQVKIVTGIRRCGKSTLMMLMAEELRRQYRVNIGKVGELGVDFIAQTSQRKIYIQVAESLLSPDVRERELRPLMSIPDHHEKMVLSMDRSFVQSQDGIKIVNLLDFLLDAEAY